MLTRTAVLWQIYQSVVLYLKSMGTFPCQYFREYPYY